MANISEKIIEVRLIMLSVVARKTEEDVVTRTWKMEVGGHQHTYVEIPKLRWIE